MKVFIDTNILLDFMCRREPFYKDAYKIFRKAANNELDLVVSVLTIVNTQYTARKYGLSMTDVSGAIKSLLSLVTVSPIDGQMVEYAYSVDDKDKEDVLQYMSAKSANVDYLISRDKKGFVNAPVTVLSLEEFCDMFE